MITEFVRLTDTEADSKIFEKAGELIREGSLVAFPTETVYGLGANAYLEDAAKKIFSAKGRPSDNPLIVHVSSPEEAEAFAFTNDLYYKLAKRFMPGPLTVILPKKNNIPDSVTGGLDSVAVRCPEHPGARALIKASGVPVAAPSANISGSPSPTCADHVFDDLNGKIDMIIDGGECRIGVESTVIRLDGDDCTVLRPGDIIPRELLNICRNVYIAEAVKDPSAAGEKPQSPGMKYKHYAPSCRLVLLSGSNKQFADYVNTYSEKCIVLSYTENIDDFDKKIVFDIGSETDPKEQMHCLFKVLRETDGIDAEVIFAHLPPEGDEYLALYNRIIRAAGCEVVKL